ncbi:hypothetical protein I6M70_17195 [Acinetobacter pittii]|uniref:hypothetical protein n=1 Tax=Acinetobacter pittii TaxID=48296 RepID=UPI0018FF541C|nr:hypothetical protein [Acinetobacter pittii]MBJ8481097.1 hypothetical protein [Acinetobacter pittii]
MSDKLILDVRVSGYKEAPTRLIAVLDVASGQLYISDEKPFKPVKRERSVVERVKDKLRRNKTLIITDSPDLDDWNLLYIEKEHLNEVVRAYRSKERDNLLTLDQKVQGRYRPDSVLQARKLDINTGAIWELSTETSNGHICVLLACWGAMRSTSNFMFATQLHQDLTGVEHEPDSNDFDEPFSI